jgi:hypothetical protein
VATATKAPASNRGRQCAGGEGGGVVVKSGVGGAKQGKRTKEIACAQSMHESELRRMAMPASAAWPGKDAGSLPFLSSDLALFVGLGFVSFGSRSLCQFAYVALPYRRWRRGRWYCHLTPPKSSQPSRTPSARFRAFSLRSEGGWMLERWSGCVGVLAGFRLCLARLGRRCFVGVVSLRIVVCVCVCREGWT